MANNYNPISAVKEIVKNRYATYKAKKSTMNTLTKDLPSTIMGQKNYNTAMKTVKGYYNSGNIRGARAFVKGQLQKISKQAAGTQTEKWANETLSKNYKK